MYAEQEMVKRVRNWLPADERLCLTMGDGFVFQVGVRSFNSVRCSPMSLLLSVERVRCSVNRSNVYAAQ